MFVQYNDIYLPVTFKYTHEFGCDAPFLQSINK